MLEAFHGLIVPDLVGKVGIGDRDLGRNVGDDVGIVDHSVSFGKTGCDVRGEVLISHSGLSKSVELVNVTEKAVDIKSSNCGKSGAQTVSGNIDLSVTEKSSQFLNLRTDVSLNS